MPNRRFRRPVAAMQPVTRAPQGLPAAQGSIRPPGRALRLFAARRPAGAFRYAATKYTRDWFQANDEFVAFLVQQQRPSHLLALLAPGKDQINLLFGFTLGPQALVAAYDSLSQADLVLSLSQPVAWQALLERTGSPEGLAALMRAWDDYTRNEALISRVCEQYTVTHRALERVPAHLVFAGRYRWKGLGHVFGDSCHRKFDADLARTYGAAVAASVAAVHAFRPQMTLGSLARQAEAFEQAFAQRPRLRDALLPVLTSVHATDPLSRQLSLDALAQRIVEQAGEDPQHLQVVADLLADGVCPDLSTAATLARDLD